MTVKVSAASYIVGAVLGLGGAAAKLSRLRLLRYLGDLYTTIVRSLPELLLILLLYYTGTRGLNDLIRAAGFSGDVDLSPFMAAVFSLGFISGAYMTEVFRGAILAVPKGQIEAAKAIGMSMPLRLERILLPQMLRYALPGLGNLWLVLLKDSSLVSVVSLAELTNAGRIGAGFTKHYLYFYFILGICYLILTVFSMGLMALLEKRLNRGERGLA